VKNAKTISPTAMTAQPQIFVSNVKYMLCLSMQLTASDVTPSLKGVIPVHLIPSALSVTHNTSWNQMHVYHVDRFMITV
jgi:hypothetical protein